MEKEFRPGRPDPHLPAMEKELKKQGYKIEKYKGYTQGGDFIYDPQRKLILVGIGMAGFDINRTFTEEDAKALGKQTGCEVIRVKRTSYKHYHLDTAISVLPNGKWLITPRVTDEATYKKLQAKVGAGNIIDIPVEEERYFANLIAVGRTLVMPSCSTPMKQRLEQEGLKVLTPEMVGLPSGAWDIRQGAVHCMTQQAMLWLKENDKDAYNSLMSSPEFRNSWRKKLDPAEGQNLHQQVADERVPYYRRKQAEFDLRASREDKGKC
jgi:hypothetical protein